VSAPLPSELPRKPMPPCPHPEKRVFRSKAAAARYFRRIRLPAGEKDRLRPYRCQAGDHWHLAHLLRAEQ
jgi:hypothetical protein